MSLKQRLGLRIGGAALLRCAAAWGGDPPQASPAEVVIQGNRALIACRG